MIGKQEKKVSVLETLASILFSAIIVYLLVLTMFTTATMDAAEHTTLLATNPLEKVAVIVFCFGAMFGLGFFFRQEKRRAWLSDSKGDLIHRVFLLLLGIFATLFIISAQKKPNADQYLVINTASKWRNHDFSDFQPGGYLKLFPHQCGIVLIYYFLSFLVGQNNFLALQLINVFAQVFLAKSLGDLAVETTGHKKTRILVDLMFLVFLPLTLFGTFAYGNWPGLAMSVAALGQAAGLRRDGKKIRVLWSAMLLLGALFFKQNCLILGIAVVLYLGNAFLRVKKMYLLAAMITLIGILGWHGTVIKVMAKLVTGQELESGTSKWSYVQMGLTKNDKMYDGWWNKYIQDTYEESGYDIVVQEAQVKADLAIRIAELRADPGQTLRFFSGKNASQWANPDFGSIFKNQVMKPLTEEAVSSGWVYWMLSLEPRAPFRVFMGAIQTAVLFGALLYLLLPARKRELSFFLEIAFIGGFIFHTVWEAKGQYTLSYFTLLLPLAAQGYEALTFLGRGKEGQRKAFIRLTPVLGCLCILLLLVRFTNIPLLQEIFLPWL